MELTAKNLKDKLWETLQGIQSGKVNPGEADSIASQAREILRCTNTQLQIFKQSKRDVSADVIMFAEK